MATVHPDTRPDSDNPIYWKDGKQYIRLYYFMPSEHFLDILQNDEIKVSVLERCNDPLEFMPAGEHNMIQGWRDSGGFISFSSRFDSSLMWAHYADAHKGVCLQFDFSINLVEQMEHALGKQEKNKFVVVDIEGASQFYNRWEPVYSAAAVIIEVRYAHERPEYEGCSDSGLYTDNKLQKVCLPRYLYTKSEEWEYEKEWRLMVDLKKAKGFRNNDFFVSNITKHLTGVIMGTKFNQTHALTWALILQALRKNPSIGEKMIYPSLTRAVYDLKLYSIIQKSEC